LLHTYLLKDIHIELFRAREYGAFVSTQAYFIAKNAFFAMQCVTFNHDVQIQSGHVYEKIIHAPYFSIIGYTNDEQEKPHRRLAKKIHQALK
jgi:hypothetical protein